MAGHRYWRITLDAIASGNLYAMVDVQFRTTAGVALYPSGGTASAFDSYSANPPALACDGIITTYWACNTPVKQPQWWAYDYGAGNTPAIVEMAIRSRGSGFGAQAPTKVTPCWSDDGVNWTWLKQVTLSVWADNQTQTFTVPTTPTTDLIPAWTTAQTRQDFTGVAGIQFTVTTAMTFNQIGGRCGSGTLGPQTIVLRNVTDAVELARVVIDMTGKVTGQYYYATIPSVTLVPGKTYVLWAAVTANNGYLWADDIFATCHVRNSASWASVYGSSLTGAPGGTNTTNSQYWGVDLDYVSTANYVDIAGDITASVGLGADVTFVRDLAGDLPVSIFFWADHTEDDIGIYGGFASVVSFAADLTVVSAPRYVDLAGNLGGASIYGRGKYGAGKYSVNGAIEPWLSAALDVVGIHLLAGELAPIVSFAGDVSLLPFVKFTGDLAPLVTFAGNLTAIDSETGDLTLFVSFAGQLSVLTPLELVGDIVPQVTFAGELELSVDLAGGLAPQIDLGASLTFNLALAGQIPLTVTIAGSTLTAGPLWVTSTPCPDAPWAPSESCPPTMWTPSELCDGVEWEDSELCNG